MQHRIVLESKQNFYLGLISFNRNFKELHASSKLLQKLEANQICIIFIIGPFCNWTK